MRKRVLAVALFLCVTTLTKAEVNVTDISDMDNVIYAENVTGSAGSVVTMSIQMNNIAEVPGFQFNLVLPEGVTVPMDDEFYMIDLSLERTTAQKTNTFSSAIQTDGSILVLAASTGSYPFSGNSGEVATVQLEIAEDLADGDYPVVITNICMSNSQAQNCQSIKEVVSQLTVKSIEYDEGYSLSIVPFSVANGADFTIPMNFSCIEENVTDIEFDIDMPSVLSRTKNGRVPKAFDSADENRMYVNASDGDHSITVNTSHVVIASLVEDEYKFIAGTDGPLMNMYYSTADDVAYGVYPIYVTNIKMKRADGVVLNVPPFTSYVKIGNPTIGQTISLNGVVYADVLSAITAENGITCVDMTNVTSIEGILTFSDGKDFIAPKKPVEVEEVVYNRTMSTDWGTICLPFELSSNFMIQFYKLSGVSNTTMTFEPVETVEAGIPAVFKKLNGSCISINESNVTILAGSSTWNKIVSDKPWTMKGTLVKKELDPSTIVSDIYYINGDKFYYGNQTFTVPAYRGWFETLRMSNAPVRGFSINPGDATTELDVVELENGNVMFDLSGRKINGEHKSQIVIVNGEKYIK